MFRKFRTAGAHPCISGVPTANPVDSREPVGHFLHATQANPLCKPWPCEKSRPAAQAFHAFPCRKLGPTAARRRDPREGSSSLITLGALLQPPHPHSTRLRSDHVHSACVSRLQSVVSECTSAGVRDGAMGPEMGVEGLCALSLT